MVSVESRWCWRCLWGKSISLWEWNSLAIDMGHLQCQKHELSAAYITAFEYRLGPFHLDGPGLTLRDTTYHLQSSPARLCGGGTKHKLVLCPKHHTHVMGHLSCAAWWCTFLWVHHICLRWAPVKQWSCANLNRMFCWIQSHPSQTLLVCSCVFLSHTCGCASHRKAGVTTQKCRSFLGKDALLFSSTCVLFLDTSGPVIVMEIFEFQVWIFHWPSSDSNIYDGSLSSVALQCTTKHAKFKRQQTTHWGNLQRVKAVSTYLN